MTIAAVAGQAGGVTFDNATSTSRAFGSNVSANSLVIVVCWKQTTGGASDPFAAGDCTKSAGTATIGTPSLDASIEFASPAPDFVAVGIWSVLVTGAGSLTMQVGNMAAGNYGGLGTDEYTGTFDASRVEASATGSDATDNVTSAFTSNASSAGAALFVSGLSQSKGASEALTPDAAFTQIYEEEDGSAHQPGSAIRRIVSVGTTDRGEWSMPGSNLGYCAALAVYKEVAAGGGARRFQRIVGHRFALVGQGGLAS